MEPSPGLVNLPITLLPIVQFQFSNGIKPYHPSIPTGPKGATDYSTWKFTLTQYAVIKEGANKITSKITCHEISGNLTKFNSVNVTGIGS